MSSKPTLRALMESVKARREAVATSPSRQLATPLSARERAALKVAEAAIEEHIGAWTNVSNAMLEISGKRLYRETHATFEDYMRQRWGLSRSQGHRLVLHAEVLASPVGERIRNEAQSREVAAYLDDPDMLERIVDRAEELQAGRPLTAKALRQARLELTVTPEQAQQTRIVYRVAEFTAAMEREWQEDAMRYVGHFVGKLPPERWPEAHAAVQSSPPKDQQTERELFVSALTRIAFDVPLTDQVTQFLRAGCKVVDITPIDLFTGSITHILKLGEMPILSLMETMLTKTKPDEPEAVEAIHEMQSATSEASATAAGMLSARMSEVVQAIAIAPAMPQHEWTPTEVEHGLQHFRADDGKPWPDGPLRQEVKKLSVAFLAATRDISESFPAEVRSRMPDFSGVPTLAELVEDIE
jgi:hypothetical protein